MDRVLEEGEGVAPRVGPKVGVAADLGIRRIGVNRPGVRKPVGAQDESRRFENHGAAVAMEISYTLESTHSPRTSVSRGMSRTKRIPNFSITRAEAGFSGR